ncbi:hypothetical protein FPV67DRAFT_1449256 [Lyophyllum atratum]|nr:hypothetical protein FPV67DRAFT_1449256 [Lyophyllum atratum]
MSSNGDMVELYEAMFYESPVFGPADITAIQDAMFSHRPSYCTFYSAVLVDADCKIGALKNVHHLAIEYWVQTASLVDELFVDFAQSSAYVDYIPSQPLLDMAGGFTLFFSPQASFCLRVGQINTFVFHHLCEKIWYGNILVVKHDDQGFTAEVNTSDLAMIENIVIGLCNTAPAGGIPGHIEDHTFWDFRVDNDRPHDINVLTPRGTTPEWVDVMHLIGFTSLEVIGCYDGLETRCRPPYNHCHRESQQFNSSIAVGLERHIPDEPHDVISHILLLSILILSMPYARLPCAEACPAVWRHTFGPPNVGQVAWGGLFNVDDVTGNMQDSDDALTQVHYKWKIGTVCTNEYCTYNSCDTDEPFFL